MKLKIIAGIVLAAIALTSCDDTTDTIGSTLTNNIDRLNVETDTFTVTSQSIVADSVLSRNSVGYLGNIKDPETGSYIKGDFMVQFHTLENYELPEKENIISRNGNNIKADSCELRLYYTDFYGDSLTTMKATAYEMATPMEENKNYYSNFDPLNEGLVRTNGIKTDKTYTLTDLSVKDSIRNTTTYVKNIRITLNKPYTDKSGKTYSNYGTYIMEKFYENPKYFANSYNFIHNVCPGFYIKSKTGVGSMAYIYLSQLNVYFKYKDKIDGKDSIVVGTSSFAGTEEVLQTTTVNNDEGQIKQLAANNSCTYLKTPAGIFTQINIPVAEIMKGHENDTINSAKLILPRINASNVNGLPAPKTLLIIPQDSIYSFFENDDIANNKSSFITTYSSTDNTYTFNNISGLIRAMADAKNNGTTSPNWNKAVVIPVTTTYVTKSNGYGQTVQVLAKVVHDMSLSSTRLVGGSNNAFSPLKLTVIYSKFK